MNSTISIRMSVDDYFRMGYTYQVAGDLHAAAECYLKSIERAPSAEAHTFLGYVLAQMGESDAAISECEKALKIDAEFGNAWNDLGVYWLEKRQSQKAIEHLKKALEAKNYDNPAATHFNLARAYVHEGMMITAEKELRLSLAINPDYRQSRNLLETVQKQLH